MTRHPFRFGVNVFEAATRDEWIAKAQKIEALGYDFDRSTFDGT